jgi:hypothetical protein
MAAGSSVSSSGTNSSMKKPKPLASDAIGISVLDEAFGGTSLEVEEPIQVRNQCAHEPGVDRPDSGHHC